MWLCDSHSYYRRQGEGSQVQLAVLGELGVDRHQLRDALTVAEATRLLVEAARLLLRGAAGEAGQSLRRQAAFAAGWMARMAEWVEGRV